MIRIAEQVRKKEEKVKDQSAKESIQKSTAQEVADQQLKDQEIREAKLRKLRKLQELEAELAKLEQEKSSEELHSEQETSFEEKDVALEDLEQKLASQIKSATKGEIVFKESSDDKTIAKEMAALRIEVAEEKLIITKTTYEKLLELHEWIEEPQYGFMYSMPHPKKAKEDFESWREEWSQVLLDYARVGTFHIIFPKQLLTEKPFNQFVNRKKSIDELCDALIEKDLAEWLGNKRKREKLRVYWKSLDEWKTIIEQWAYNNAIFDVIMVPDIRKSGQEFALLPVEDLYSIFRSLEKNHKATMIELENNQFGIKFNFV